MRAAVALLGLAFAGTALGQDAVIVHALRDPVVKSYRKMAKGRALFEELHAMAPSAALRFRLWPRKADTPMERIAVAIVADSFERPISVGGDRTFALPDDERALREDASVRPNRKAGTLTWRADIRTPGLPPHTRRLGDLRLECRVGMASGLVSHYPSVFERLMDVLLGGAAFCERREPPYLFFADSPLFAVTLVDGERRRTLSVRELYAGVLYDPGSRAKLAAYCDCAALLDRAYYVPLGERRWPDDTRVELQYMDGPAEADADGYSMLVGSTKGEMRSIFGEPKVLRFGNRELWVYEVGGRGQRDEIVALFGSDGIVEKARLRLSP